MPIAPILIPGVPGALVIWPIPIAVWYTRLVAVVVAAIVVVIVAAIVVVLSEGREGH